MKCLFCGKEAKKTKKDYQYVESSLDNVVLSGINVYECCGEVMPEIKNVEKLHKLIALAIVKKSSLLSGKEFRFIRKQMLLKEKEIAAILGVSPVSVSRWEKENAKIGASNDRLIRMLYIQSVEENNNKVFCGIVNGLATIKQSAKQSKISIGQKELMRSTSAREELFACV